MSIFLGIDTSNYTTSVAASGDVLINLRKIIDIKEGMRGIRQSDGVFVHLKELPCLFEKLEIDMSQVRAVGVSVRPRSQDGSYMPVFVAGKSFARVIAKALSVPVYEYSHQDGHIMAGIVSGGFYGLLEKPFVAVHLSGGTTEILRCEYKNGTFNARIIGGTKDISAGQLIDRLGVKLGIGFPCGQEIDRLSGEWKGTSLPLRTSVDGGYMNFSGIETKLLQMVGKEDGALLAKSALDFIGRSLKDALVSVAEGEILFVGGVSSNTWLREFLTKNLENRVHFATPHLSLDNAVGIAELCRMSYLKGVK